MSINFSEAENSSFLIEGKGQKVYWKNCWIKVYHKGEPKSTEEYNKCDGWVIILADIEVIFDGQGGSILEK